MNGQEFCVCGHEDIEHDDNHPNGDCEDYCPGWWAVGPCNVYKCTCTTYSTGAAL